MTRITTLLFLFLAYQPSYADKEREICPPPISCGWAPPTCKQNEQVNCTLGYAIGDNACLKLFSCELSGEACTLKKAIKVDACLTCRDNCLKAKWESDPNPRDNWKDCFKACAKKHDFDSYPY